jgi:opacity protein-like surface antigen
MKKLLFTYLLSFIFIVNAFGQLEKKTNQMGISALPVFDVFNIFPNNKISGFAMTGNFGYFAVKNLSIGMQPYYAQVSNSYTSSLLQKENQEIKLYGLNTYVRYYFIKKEKFLTYSLASIGFGNSDQKTTILSSPTFPSNPHYNKSTMVFMLGVGADYFIMNNLALEVNVPYFNVKYFSTDPNMHFQTAVPTIGLQFYWE